MHLKITAKWTEKQDGKRIRSHSSTIRVPVLGDMNITEAKKIWDAEQLLNSAPIGVRFHFNLVEDDQ